jgi:hypothetical protein
MTEIIKADSPEIFTSESAKADNVEDGSKPNEVEIGEELPTTEVELDQYIEGKKKFISTNNKLAIAEGVIAVSSAALSGYSFFSGDSFVGISLAGMAIFNGINLLTNRMNHVMKSSELETAEGKKNGS